MLRKKFVYLLFVLFLLGALTACSGAATPEVDTAALDAAQAAAADAQATAEAAQEALQAAQEAAQTEGGETDEMVADLQAQLAEAEAAQATAQAAAQEAAAAAAALATEQASTPAEDSARSLTFFTTETDPAQLAALNAIVAEYHELHPDVFIDVVTGTPATRGERMRMLLSAQADAGIFEIEPAFSREWAEAGYLLPLNDIFEEINEAESYVPGSYFELDGNVYALPYATSVYGLWYRKDLFEAAGLQPPTNYEEMLVAAQTLTDPANSQYGFTMPGSTNAGAVYFSTFLWQQCLDYYTPQGELTFDDPAALEALKKWVALAQYAPPGFETWSFGDQITAFVTGQAAMSMYAGRLGIRLAEQAPDLQDKVGIVPLPWATSPDSPYVTYGAWSRFAISANSSYPETAKDFLKFFLSGERLASYDATVLGHMVPPTEGVGNLLETWDSDYATAHADWLAFFNENAQFTNHPSLNMGSVEGCNFSKKDYGPPWAGAVFSTGGVIDLMLQEIFIGGTDPEVAWQNALTQMSEAAETWKAEHPDWQPPTP